MKSNLISLISLISLIGLISLMSLIFGAKGANAAFFSLDPKSQNVSQNDTFDVKLNINTENEQTTAADVVLIFDQEVLEATEIAAGDFYPQNFKNISAGKIYIGGSVEKATQTKAGTDLLATITFKGKSAGSSVLRFDCTPGKTSDSNIIKGEELTDILDCAKLENGTYTVGGGNNNPTSTPKPTFQPTCTVTPSPKPPTATPTGELPEAGTIAPSILLLGIGAFLTGLGILIKL